MKKQIAIAISIMMVMCLASTSVVFAKAVKAKSVTLNITSVTMIEKGAVALQATQTPAKAKEKLSWSSSNKAVATVSAKGVVTAVSAGNAVITVKTSKSKKKATCKVTVVKCLSENDVKALVKNNSSSGGAAVDPMDWEDGTELSLFQGTKINYTVPGQFPVYTDVGTENGLWEFKENIDIKEATVKKYHFEEYTSNDDFRLFKYVLDIKGTLSTEDASKYEIVMTYYDANLSSTNWTNEDEGYYIAGNKWTMDGKDFTVHKELYSDVNYAFFLPRFTCR